MERMGPRVSRVTYGLCRNARHTNRNEKGKESPFSMDANLLHISYEGGPLEDPWVQPPEEMWRWSVSPEAAPNGSHIRRNRL